MSNEHIKYNLDKKAVTAALKAVGADEYTYIQPNSKNGLAKQIADKLGMDGDNLNVRRGIYRYIQREMVHPKK